MIIDQNTGVSEIVKKLIFILSCCLISSCASNTAVKNDQPLLNEIELIDRSNGNRLVEIESTDYQIGEQDLLGIEVFQVEDFSLTVRVNSNGLVSLPLIGKVQAAGKTSDQLQELIKSKLEENYLQNPHVSVFIKEYTSQRVTVEGGVNRPGVFPIKGRTTLLQAIATAQGLTDLADKETVKLFRSNKEGKRLSYIYDINLIRNGEATDPILKGDDVIVVNRSASRSVIKSITDTLRGFISFGNPL